MLSPDKFFEKYNSDFSPETRNEAVKLFRRAIRDYYAMRRSYVIDPESGRRVKSVVIGKVIQQQKSQRRIVTRRFTGNSTAGRPKGLAINHLISRLFILWGQYANTPATFSWKAETGKRTNFEAFLRDLLPRLGAPDVRRYVENHWRDRK